MNALRSPDPDRDGNAITIVEILGRTAKELDAQFSDDPTTKAKLLSAIGE